MLAYLQRPAKGEGQIPWPAASRQACGHDLKMEITGTSAKIIGTARELCSSPPVTSFTICSRESCCCLGNRQLTVALSNQARLTRGDKPCQLQRRMMPCHWTALACRQSGHLVPVIVRAARMTLDDSLELAASSPFGHEPVHGIQHDGGILLRLPP